MINNEEISYYGLIDLFKLGFNGLIFTRIIILLPAFNTLVIVNFYEIRMPPTVFFIFLIRPLLIFFLAATLYILYYTFHLK